MEGGAGGLERLAEVDGTVEEVAEGGFDDGEDFLHLGVRGAGRGRSCWFRHVWDVGRVGLKGYGGSEKGEKMVLGESVMKMVRVEMAMWCSGGVLKSGGNSWAPYITTLVTVVSQAGHVRQTMFLPSSTCVKDEKLKHNSPMKRVRVYLATDGIPMLETR